MGWSRPLLLLALAGCSHRTETVESAPPRATVEVACAAGFARDGAGCRAILPEACDVGTFAIPGEETCHPVADCATVTGDLYVRTGATGGDGSSAKPFGKIGEAIAAAKDDARIAIGKGVYAEDLLVNKRVTLEGECGAIVRGVSADAAIEITSNAVLKNLEIRGPGTCVWVEGAPSVSLDHVWLHDCGSRGIEAGGYGARSITTVSRSLIERVRASGIGAFGAEITLDSSVIRDVAARTTNPQSGDGVLARPDKTGKVTGVLTIARSVIERTTFSAVTASGVPATISASVIRDIAPMTDGTHGLGVYAGGDPPTMLPAATLLLRDALIERTHGVGVQCSLCTIERVSIRDVASENDQFGYGIELDRGKSTIDGIAVERCHGAGIVVHASIATLRSIYVAGILPEGDQFGDGVVVTGDEDGKLASDVTIDRARIDRCARAGIAVFGSKLTLSSAELACNLIDLNVGRRVGFTASGMPIEADYALADAGKNNCGCEKTAPCLARTEEITPVLAH